MNSAESQQVNLPPETVDALNRLAGRVDEIEFLLDSIGGLLRRGPEIADNIGDSVLEMRTSLQSGGDGASVSHTDIQTLPRLQSMAKAENLDTLLRTIESLTQILSSPQIQSFLETDALPATETLVRLAKRADELEFMLEMLSGLIRRGPEIADTLNHTVLEVRASFDQANNGGTAQQLSATLNKVKGILTPENIDKIVSLFTKLQSTILDEKTIDTIGGVGEALVESSEIAQQKDTSISGIFSLMKALKDPDVARTIGFALEFAKAFGKKIK